MITPEIKLSAQKKVMYARISTSERAMPSQDVSVNLIRVVYGLDEQYLNAVYTKTSDIYMKSGRIVCVSYLIAPVNIELSDLLTKVEWMSWSRIGKRSDSFLNSNAFFFRFELMNAVEDTLTEETINIIFKTQIVKDPLNGLTAIRGPLQYISAKLTYTAAVRQVPAPVVTFTWLPNIPVVPVVQDEPMIFEWLI